MTVVSDYRALLSNDSWTYGRSGDAAILTYSFSAAPTSYMQSSAPSAAATFSPVNDAEKNVIRAALAQWSAVSGLTFYETTQVTGDITFGFYDLTKVTGSSGTAGLGNFPSTGMTTGVNGVPVSTTFQSQGGDIYFDKTYQTNPFEFSDFAHVAIHEIGHALGLKHPFDLAPIGPTYTLVSSLDNGDETVMSYTGRRSATIGPLDIQAIQAMYGTKAGAAHPYVEVWNPASQSLTLAGAANTARNIFGSGGNDVFYSLSAGDVLSGGEGDDLFYLSGKPATVNGGTGRDTVVTSLVYSTATVISGSGSGNRSIYLPGYSGSQTFTNVAYLNFTNGVYTTATNTFVPYDTGFYAASSAVKGNNQVITVAGGAVSVARGTGDAITLTGGGSVTTVAGSVETIRLGSDSGTVLGDGRDTIFGGSGPGTIDAGSGSDIVVGGGGALTFHAGSGNNLVFAGTGGLLYMGGTGNDTVVGAIGHPLTVVGGSGGGTYFGGGYGSIMAGVGARAILVGLDGDQLYSAGNAGDWFGVLGGNVTMSGLNSTGNDIFFGAAGTGTLTFIAGSGDDLLGLGQGINYVTLGAGNSTVFANTGNTAVSTIFAGSGSASIGLGGKSADLVIHAASSARTLTLFGFQPGPDKITLQGFNAAAASSAIAAQMNSPGLTLLTLADNTTISLVGVSHADASFFG